MFCFWTFILSFNIVSSLIKNNLNDNFIIKKSITTKLFNNDYINDIKNIEKFKSFFVKENYNDLLQDILNNKVSKIYIDNKYKEIVSIPLNNIDENFLFNHYHYTETNPIVIPNLIQKTTELNVPVYFVNFNSEFLSNLANDVFTISMVSISTLFFLSLVSSFRGGPGGSGRPNNMNNQNFMNMFNMNKKFDKFEKQNVSLTSWAGSPEVIDECKEIITYLEKKELYKTIGAEMPKGILLEGPPGTGKTLLAKAIATETNSTFIPMSGSEFVEIFVGMGANRVRELFENARKNKPSIIFIDEIDAVGRQRGTGINMANDEREQTLNQILYEMDGFNNNDDIVVMAATNRKDVLDQALLRPGRFDRIIRVPLPDRESREKIIKYYLSVKKTEKSFDISSIAELTEGFSGAQLKNLINEAAILSVKNNYDVIMEKYIFDSFEKLIVGLIKNNKTVDPITKTRVAIHESGHALLSILFKDYFDFKKVSIQQTYNGAGGYTIFFEKAEIREGGLFTKDLLKKRLIVILGGKAAESIMYTNDFVSFGAIQDLKEANNLAKRMIGNYGMGNKLEVFFNDNVNDESNPFLGRGLSVGDKYSEYTRYIMDKESLDLVNEAYKEAKKLLEENIDKLLKLSELLQNSTTLMRKDVDEFYL